MYFPIHISISVVIWHTMWVIWWSSIKFSKLIYFLLHKKALIAKEDDLDNFIYFYLSDNMSWSILIKIFTCAVIWSRPKELIRLCLWLIIPNTDLQISLRHLFVASTLFFYSGVLDSCYEWIISFDFFSPLKVFFKRLSALLQNLYYLFINIPIIFNADDV